MKTLRWGLRLSWACSSSVWQSPSPTTRTLQPTTLSRETSNINSRTILKTARAIILRTTQTKPATTTSTPTTICCQRTSTATIRTAQEISQVQIFTTTHSPLKFQALTIKAKTISTKMGWVCKTTMWLLIRTTHNTGKSNKRIYLAMTASRRFTLLLSLMKI